MRLEMIISDAGLLLHFGLVLLFGVVLAAAHAGEVPGNRFFLLLRILFLFLIKILLGLLLEVDAYTCL